jgi:tetratricopeptide (TPR) repeat protein
MALLRGWLDRAVSGQPAVVLVTGEAGIGKSRLGFEFAEEAARVRALVLVGACLDVGAGVLPYAPVTEVLRQLAATLDPEDLDAILGGARADLGRLLPELADKAGEAVAPDASAAPARLFERILGLLGRLAATRPVVLIVEDVHWADRSTQDLLVFLRRNLRSGVMLVMTCRTDELRTGHPIRPFLAELERSGVVDRIDLGRLDRRRTAALIAGVLGRRASSRFVGQVFERSDGNPFHVEELIAAETSGGGMPPHLRELLLARVEALDESAQRVLGLASVANGPADADLLGVVGARVGVDRDALSDGLRAAVSRHLLVSDAAGERLGFRHALVQEAVYHNLLPAERSRLHAAVAAVLEERHGDGGDPRVLAELAYHWYAAHDDSRALAGTLAAGRAAATSFAPAEAVRQFERALALWDRVPHAATEAAWNRVDVLRAAAEAAYLTGDWARSAAHLRTALDHTDRHAEPLRAAQVMLQLARCLWDTDEAGAVLAEAEQLVPRDPPTSDLALLLSMQIRVAFLEGRDKAVMALAEEMLAVARAASDSKMIDLATMWIGRAYCFTGRGGEGLALWRRSLHGSVAEDSEHIGPMWVNYIAMLGPCGHADQVPRAADEGELVTRRLGLSAGFAAMIMANAASALVTAGRWGEAEDFIEKGFDLQPGAVAELWLRALHGRLLVMKGDVAAGRTELLAALDLAISEGDNQDITTVHTDLAACSLAEDEPGQARRHIDIAIATPRSDRRAGVPVPARARRGDPRPCGGHRTLGRTRRAAPRPGPHSSGGPRDDPAVRRQPAHHRGRMVSPQRRARRTGLVSGHRGVGHLAVPLPGGRGAPTPRGRTAAVG